MRDGVDTDSQILTRTRVYAYNCLRICYMRQIHTYIQKYTRHITDTHLVVPIDSECVFLL